MILIAHRGNTKGPKPDLENNPQYILDSINDGFNCEIDVWYDDGFWLGHDEPQYKTNFEFLQKDKLWVHCKNVEALALLQQHLNCFWHQNDDYTLTSKDYIWCYPGKQPSGSRCICVMPEIYNLEQSPFIGWHGVCSDFVSRYV